MTFAHAAEDREVLEFFGSQAGVFVEAGANHPVVSSQTWLLEQHDWSGVLIEPNPQLAALCRQLRPRSKVFECALIEPGGPPTVQMRFPAPSLSELARIVSAPLPSPSEQDPDTLFTCSTRTLDEVLAEAGIDRIDYLSVDLEGYEPFALRGFSWARWKPRLVSVEDHCESLATWRVVRASGYRFLRRIGDNDWYVPPESPLRASLKERRRLIRKKFLSLPFRQLRRLSRRMRGRTAD